MSVTTERLTTERVLGNIEAAVEMISHQVPALAKKLEGFQLSQTELNAASMEKYTYVLERLSVIEESLKAIKESVKNQGTIIDDWSRELDESFGRIDCLEGKQLKKVEKQEENKKIFKRGCISVTLYLIKIILAATLAGFGLGVLR